MAAQTIECQLAQSQIGRYLAGTDMSPEAVSQLELHISECPQCSFFVEAKRAELRKKAEANSAAVSVLDEAKHIHPFARNVTPPTEAMESLVEVIRKKTETAAPGPVVVEEKREPALAKPIQWKVFAYSAALGAVLLGMSHFTSNPTALFGERAKPAAGSGAALAAAPSNENVSTEKPKGPEATGVKASGDPFAQDQAVTPPVSEVTPKVADATTKQTGQNVSDARNATTPIAPIANPNPTNTISSTKKSPRVSVRRRSARRTARTPRRTNRRPSPPAGSENSIRVYDQNGNPVSGG